MFFVSITYLQGSVNAGGGTDRHASGGFTRAAAQTRPGSSGRPTHTNRLPIEFRRGRCPHRPGGTSPQNIRRAACPHAAARHTRRVPLSGQPAQAQSASRMEMQRLCESKARNLHSAAVAWLKGTDAGGTSAAERIPKPWFWRRSFLPFFRRRKKGRRGRHKNRWHTRVPSYRTFVVQGLRALPGVQLLSAERAG